MLTAHIHLYIEVQFDNYYEGAGIKQWTTFNEQFTLNFNDTLDLKNQLADYLSAFRDIDKQDFIQHISNESENNRFDYSQHEDKDNFKIELSKDNPDGYLVDYMFYIDKVTQEVEYVFE